MSRKNHIGKIIEILEMGVGIEINEEIKLRVAFSKKDEVIFLHDRNDRKQKYRILTCTLGGYGDKYALYKVNDNDLEFVSKINSIKIGEEE